MSDPLRELQAAFERAQQRPPDVQMKRRVTLPQAIRTTRDSRGRVRQSMLNVGKARQAQIEKARREMLAQAKPEVIAKAKEQLSP